MFRYLDIILLLRRICVFYLYKKIDDNPGTKKCQNLINLLFNLIGVKITDCVDPYRAFVTQSFDATSRCLCAFSILSLHWTSLPWGANSPPGGGNWEVCFVSAQSALTGAGENGNVCHINRSIFQKSYLSRAFDICIHRGSPPWGARFVPSQSVFAGAGPLLNARI